MKISKKEVQPGDQFVQLGKIQVLWDVVDCLDIPNMPPHAHLKEFGGKRVLTTSFSALLDKTLFKRSNVEREAQPLIEVSASSTARIYSLFGQRS